MNDSLELPGTCATVAPHQAELVDPNLTVSLRSDCGAIDGDLRDAAALTVDFEKQISGQSKEIAHLKWLVEKTRSHHAHLQEGITRLREERHPLANEAMRAVGFEMQLKKNDR